MSRQHTSFILGYHGCSERTGEDVLAGRSILKPSNEKYDWLGPGAYFWEADPLRALEWAKENIDRGRYGTPFVLGAIIDLGNCLDLMSREGLVLVRDAYLLMRKAHDSDSGLGPLPRNEPLKDGDGDNLLRYLDCATIKYLHLIMAERGEEPFDTVRGLFPEGGALYPGSGFKKKSHVQVAVRTPGNIKGYFRVSPSALKR